jgi:hypothetical protein
MKTFMLLHTDEQPHGRREVLVNISNVLFIQPNHTRVGGSVFSFHAVEGHVAGDLWVVEEFENLKERLG